MPPSGRIVVARKPRRSRKPVPHKPEPACGPVVRVVKGRAVAKLVDPDAEDRARAGVERLMADPRRATGIKALGRAS